MIDFSKYSNASGLALEPACIKGLNAIGDDEYGPRLVVHWGEGGQAATTVYLKPGLDPMSVRAEIFRDIEAARHPRKGLRPLEKELLRVAGDLLAAKVGERRSILHRASPGDLNALLERDRVAIDYLEIERHPEMALSYCQVRDAFGALDSSVLGEHGLELGAALTVRFTKKRERDLMAAIVSAGER
jgi:hypothetical protein